jgi:hypothetical protein
VLGDANIAAADAGGATHASRCLGLGGWIAAGYTAVHSPGNVEAWLVEEFMGANQPSPSQHLAT